MVIGGVLLLTAAAAGGGWWYFQRGKTASTETAVVEGPAPAALTDNPSPTQQQPAQLTAPNHLEEAHTPQQPSAAQPPQNQTKLQGRVAEAQRADPAVRTAQPVAPPPPPQSSAVPPERATEPPTQGAAVQHQVAATPMPQSAPPAAMAPSPVVETPRPPVARTEIPQHRPQVVVPAAGFLTWSGRLRKSEPLAIDGNGASSGTLQGTLPGVPIMIEVDPKDIGVAEAPGPGNGWRRLVLRSRSDRNIVMTIRWQRLGN